MQKTSYTVDQIKAAHGRASGDLDNMLAFLDGKRPAELREWVTTIADLCELAGEKESDYIIPENGTDEQMRDAFYKRLELQEIVFNGGTNLDMIATPSEERYYVWFNIVKDAEAPFGFRLSFYVYAFDCDCAFFGARPEFRRQADAEYCFKTWTSDYEGFIHYYNKCKQSKNRKLCTR